MPPEPALGATGGSFGPPVFLKSTGERSPSPVAPVITLRDIGKGVRVTAAEFRSIALSLPEALEGEHMGHPDFRVESAFDNLET